MWVIPKYSDPHIIQNACFDTDCAVVTAVPQVTSPVCCPAHWSLRIWVIKWYSDLRLIRVANFNPPHNSNKTPKMFSVSTMQRDLHNSKDCKIDRNQLERTDSIQASRTTLTICVSLCTLSGISAHHAVSKKKLLKWRNNFRKLNASHVFRRPFGYSNSSCGIKKTAEPNLRRSKSILRHRGEQLTSLQSPATSCWILFNSDHFKPEL